MHHMLTHITQRHSLRQGYIEGTDFARILGAIGIIIFHFACYNDSLHPYLYRTSNYFYGQMWVAMFFGLSGACIARSNTDTRVLTFYKK